MKNIELNGGVIVIGSLFWETEENCINKNMGEYRKKWREENFQKESINIELPIRYGRESRSRKTTYTMVFSNNIIQSDYGLGKVLSYLRPVKSFEQLEILAIELALAEGIYKKENNRRLVSNWGSVAIVFNDKFEKENQGVYEYYSSNWTKLFSQFKDTLDPKNYRVGNNETPAIDCNGRLTIDLKDKIEEFDFLLATPVEINVEQYPAAEKIAKQINKHKYSTYFVANQKHGILTKDDKVIIENLDKQHKKTLKQNTTSS